MKDSCLEGVRQRERTGHLPTSVLWPPHTHAWTGIPTHARTPHTEVKTKKKEEMSRGTLKT